MKDGTKIKSTKGVTKGGPSGLVISLALHAAAFLLAGALVVFTVVNKEEKQFTPPQPVERPKMKLKKPKVKVKKSAKPRSTNRIVTKVNKATMPDIQLPEMSGVGDGLGDVGGFDFGGLPNAEELSQFGNKESVGSDLEGVFYDFNRLRSGTGTSTPPLQLADLVDKFFRRDWSPSVFQNYYRAPKKLYATSIAMPPLQSYAAPLAFGEEGGAGWCWLVHYKGQLVYGEDIRFRFWGFGDDVLAVRVNGEIVLLACFPQWVTELDDATAHHWQSSSADNRKFPMGNHHSVVGDWIELKANEPQDIEVLLGESAGGIFSAMLLVEVEGVEYEKNPHRFGPCLPFFKTAEFTQDMVELIYSQLHPGEATCELGPVFNDYDNIGPTQRLALTYTDEPPKAAPKLLADAPAERRVWTTATGKEIQATYKTRMGQSVVLETKKNKQVTVPIKELSEEDQMRVTLLNPPTFKMELVKTSDQRQLGPVSIWLDNAERKTQIFDWQFGAQLKQTSPYNGYTLPLKIEYFVFGEEADGDHYVLLDRYSDVYTPTKEASGVYEITSPATREMVIYSMAEGGPRGEKYGGYMITMTDQNGLITQYFSTHDWLFKNLENLKKVPVGKHFNKNCNRVMPARPREQDRFTITL